MNCTHQVCGFSQLIVNDVIGVERNGDMLLNTYKGIDLSVNLGKYMGICLHRRAVANVCVAYR